MNRVAVFVPVQNKMTKMALSKISIQGRNLHPKVSHMEEIKDEAYNFAKTFFFFEKITRLVHVVCSDFMFSP